MDESAGGYHGKILSEVGRDLPLSSSVGANDRKLPGAAKDRRHVIGVTGR